MMFTLQHSILLILAYVWGSIPVGYLLVKMATGKNIREHGSGNIGSTNVKRVAGKKWALLTQLLDMLKGLLPVALYLLLCGEPRFPVAPLGLALALMPVLGHTFSLFLKFKGGKGVNTSLGAAVLLSPVAVFSAVAVFFLVKWRTGYVSLGSLMLALTLPLVQWALYGRSEILYFLLLCAALIVVRHHSNISRLLHRNELKP